MVVRSGITDTAVGIPSTALGNLGATETINFDNGAVQTGTLDQNCTITLPSTASATRQNRLLLILTQGGSGGFLPTFTLASGSIQWEFNHTPVIGDINATAADYTVFEFVFTATSVYGKIVNPNVDSNPLSVYASGTAYSLTASSAAIDFGTTDPSLTLTKYGVYLIIARARLNYNGATFGANRTTTLKLRRTNNTAADLTDGSVTATTAITSAVTSTFVDQTWTCLYTTSNSNDVIAMYGDVSAVPSPGSLDVAAASIIAIRIGQ